MAQICQQQQHQQEIDIYFDDITQAQMEDEFNIIQIQWQVQELGI
jgi:hypothetical protein